MKPRAQSFSTGAESNADNTNNLKWLEFTTRIHLKALSMKNKYELDWFTAVHVLRHHSIHREHKLDLLVNGLFKAEGES